MRANTKRLPFFFVMLAGAAAGFVLRRWQLRTAYDSSGLVISGSTSTWALGIFSVLITLFFLWTARRLPRKTEYSAAFPTGRAELAVSLAAAALLLAGCVCSLISNPSGFNLAIQFLGILSAFCILATAVPPFPRLGPGAADPHDTLYLSGGPPDRGLQALERRSRDPGLLLRAVRGHCSHVRGVPIWAASASAGASGA